MDAEQLLAIAEAVVLAHCGRHLSDLESKILQGSIADLTYEEIAKQSGYSISHVKRNVGPKLWRLLSQGLNEDVSKTNFRNALRRRASQISIGEQGPLSFSNRQGQRIEIDGGGAAAQSPKRQIMALGDFTSPQIDWGEAISVTDFQGRTGELTTLYHWVVEERCRLIALLGTGGIGKTALSVKLTQQIVGWGAGERGGWGEGVPPCSFEFVIWRSLRNAPPLETLLTELVPFLSQQQDTQANLSRLIYWLRSRRCLVILDNLETLLQPGQVGAFRQGYEDYGELLRLGAEASHQSCILLTSREPPAEVTTFAGQQLPVRSLRLSGSSEAAQAILQAKGLVGTPQQRHLLGNRYANSPLALKLIATSIQSLFDGNIATFLQENTLVFSGIRRLLDQQFERLSPLEQSIMFWLAINREWTTVDEIHQDIVPTVSRGRILEALEFLTGRSLIETATPTRLEQHRDGYTQQPVVMEYVTEQLIEQVIAELNHLNNSDLSRFNTHALIKATAKDYVRQTQTRLILQPILNCLDKPAEQFASLLTIIKVRSQLSSGYAAGNLLNLLCHADVDVSDYDFSNLTIRQAYLKSKCISQISFSKAHFENAVLTYNFGSILSVAFSPDGALLVTGDSNQKINLWQVSDGQSLATLQGHTDWVWAVAFGPQGDLLASGSDDQTVRLWDVNTQQCLRVLRGHTKQVWTVAFSPDGNLLASGSDDHTIRLWDVTTRQCLHVFQGHTNGVWSVAFSPDGETLASSSEDQTIRLWDVQTRQCLHVLRGHDSWVRSVAFAPRQTGYFADRDVLASSGDDQMIRLWDVKTQQCLHVFRGHSNQVLSVAFSPDGETIASASDDQTIRLWDVKTQQCLHVFRGHTNRVCAVAFNPKQGILASGSDDQTVRLWNMSTPQCLQVLQGYTNRVCALAFSPRGGRFVSSSDDQTIRLWDIKTRQCLHSFQGHRNRVRSVAFSPDGRLLASGSDDRTIRLWDVGTRQCLQTFQGHTSWVWSVAFSPDGAMIASGGDNQTVRLWDVGIQECLHLLQGHSSWVWSVAFSPDGTMLASGGDDQTVRLWDVKTHQSLHVFQGHTNWVRLVTFSPDGKTIASASGDQTIRLWDVTSRQCRSALRGHTGPIRSVAFSPREDLLASGSDDQTIRLWNVKTQACLHRLQGHTGWMRSVVFSPDGKILVSGSDDETMKLWDVKTGDCLATLRAPRPYEGMDITGATGLTDAQLASLIALGATETAPE